MMIKDYIQAVIRLRLATREDLAIDDQPNYGTVYFMLDDKGVLTGPFVLDKKTNLKEFNYKYSLSRIYVEETKLNKILPLYE